MCVIRLTLRCAKRTQDFEAGLDDVLRLIPTPRTRRQVKHNHGAARIPLFFRLAHCRHSLIIYLFFHISGVAHSFKDKRESDVCHILVVNVTDEHDDARPVEAHLEQPAGTRPFSRYAGWTAYNNMRYYKEERKRKKEKNRVNNIFVFYYQLFRKLEFANTVKLFVGSLLWTQQAS
jgi:hypothetical protein